MNQGNFNNFDYDHYDQPPGKRGSVSAILDHILGSPLMSKFRSPLFATSALVITAAAFAGIIALSYPGKNTPDENIPVVKAETTAFKEVPDERGGMEVPFRDSTIYAAANEGQIAERPPVENLLEQEKPLNRLEAFADDALSSEGIEDITEAPENLASSDTDAAVATQPAAGEEKAGPAPTTTSKDETAKPPENILADAKQAEKPRVEVKEIISEDEKTTPQDLVASTETAPPSKLHAPASSPETLAFVRSVLDKKDASGAPVKASPVVDTEADDAAVVLNETKPASGTPESAPSIKPGSYYIQLGSVKTESGAAGEWAKLQKTFGSALSGLEYRVQKADLAAKGTFYRIQAGPMSKDSANSVCGNIKAQKPGGCIIVQ